MAGSTLEAGRGCVFTKAQLHLLERQIDGMHRISVRLKALKYKARTGVDLQPAGGGSQYSARPPAVFAIASTRKLGGRALAGKAKRDVPGGKRGSKRARMEESDGELIHDGSEGGAGSSDSEEEAEFEEEGTSDEEAQALAASKRRAGGVATPGRRSGRQAKPLLSLREVMGGESGSEDGASPPGSGASPSAPARLGPPSPGAKAKGFILLQGHESPKTAAKPVLLPEMAAVRVAWGEGDEAFCSVCGDGDHAEGNAILFCEGAGCSVAVHQGCYGVKSIPRGKWHCDACVAKLEPTAPNCACCPVVGGALRKVVSFGKVVTAGQQAQAQAQGKKKKGGAAPPAAHVHLACALWTPELVVGDPDRMAGIKLDHMTALRAALPCARCKQGGGAVIQCSLGSCCRSFHVLCGRSAGQALTFRATDGEPLGFCAMHSAHRFRKSREAVVEGRYLAAGEEGGESGEGSGEDQGPAPAGEVNEYERQRLERIQRNKQIWDEIRARGCLPAQ